MSVMRDKYSSTLQLFSTIAVRHRSSSLNFATTQRDPSDGGGRWRELGLGLQRGMFVKGHVTRCAARYNTERGCFLLAPPCCLPTLLLNGKLTAS